MSSISKKRAGKVTPLSTGTVHPDRVNPPFSPSKGTYLVRYTLNPMMHIPTTASSGLSRRYRTSDPPSNCTQEARG